MSDNNTIIVIGGGNHHNALGVIRALGERGYGVEFVSHGSLKKNYIASSRYVTKHVALADVGDICNYLMNNVFGGGGKGL